MRTVQMSRDRTPGAWTLLNGTPDEVRAYHRAILAGAAETLGLTSEQALAFIAENTPEG